MDSQPPAESQPPNEENWDRRRADRDQQQRSQKEPKGQTWFPHPPRIETATDFIVIIFSITVATILVLLSIGVMLAGIFGADIKSYFAILTSIMTSMISALVGYLAGKGAGKIEEMKQQEGPPPP